MEVCLLGPLEILDDGGQRVAIPGGRQRTLLALLALNPGKVTPADRLIDDLWETGAPQQPANALQVVVSKLRRALGAELIETRPPGYVLAVSEEDVDAYRFERLVREGRTALADGSTESALDCFDEALGHWRGAALGEFGDVLTAVAAATRFEELRATAVEDRFDALLVMGRDADLIPDLDAAIGAMPFRERLRGQLMLALYRSGRQAEALRAFREARRVLTEELGLEPGSELRRLETAILGHDETLDVAPEYRMVAKGGKEGASTPTNLRPALSSFIGRERDIAGIGELLDDHRLVTLVGAGGCGKTRLAAEFAAGRLAAFPGGVWFAPLDTLASGDDVSSAVADALGLSTTDTAGQPALAATASVDRLRSLLSEREALVVLDNCEHVIDDAARIAVELLASAPRLRLLATSREALRVPGEMVWSVPPLGIDDAVSLFTERAQALTSDLALTDGGRVAVADLCERLDGMPLAIELIAARSKAFTVVQLAERLDDRFRLLTGGARTALPRQQTLRAVTDWSYDLLFDDERTVFERLSVFAGGCTLEAVEAVCSDDRLAAADIGGIVGRLVDKSLVVADRSGRYRLLLTLAQYGRERLADHEQGAAVRDRHAAHYSRLAEQSFVDWRRPKGRSQVWWLACLTEELDNIRAALEWSIWSADGHTSQLMTGSMGWYWWHAGRAVEGHRWLERAVACPAPTSPQVRAPAVTWAAWLGLEAGHVDAAIDHAGEAIELSEQAKDQTSLGLAWTVCSRLALLDGRVDVAAAHLDKGQQADEMTNDPWNKGIAAALRSVAAALRGQHEIAEREAVSAIDTFRAVGDICTLVSTNNELSQMLQSAGRIEEAEVAAGEAHEVSETFGLRGWQATMSSRLGSLALLRDDRSHAAELHQRAIDLARELALPGAEAAALNGLGLVHRRNNDLSAARRCHYAAHRIAERIEADADAVLSASQLGYVAEQAGDLDEARRWHGDALGLARRVHDDRGVARAIEGLAAAAAAAGDGVHAATLLGHAARSRAGAGAPPDAVEQVDIERASNQARLLLGETQYFSALQSGHGCDIDVSLATAPRASGSSR